MVCFVLMCYSHSISSPLTDLTYKYQAAICLCVFVHQLRAPHTVVIYYYSTHPLSVCLSVCRCVLSFDQCVQSLQVYKNIWRLSQTRTSSSSVSMTAVSRHCCMSLSASVIAWLLTTWVVWRLAHWALQPPVRCAARSTDLSYIMHIAVCMYVLCDFNL